MYADVQYYKVTYKGTVIPDTSLSQFLESASFDIDRLTSNRTLNYLATLTPFQLNNVKQAVCLQAEHLFNSNDPSGLTLTSLTKKGSAIVFAGGQKTRFSQFAIDRLMVTGLMYTGL